jgi:hypothetical protein
MLEGFDPKRLGKPATHFLNTTDKSLNMCNLSDSNIDYFDNKLLM